MKYDFFTCDVFTDTRFGGNPLAVIPHASGLSSGQMQLIAREFNFSETTFVLPPEQGFTRRLRIFTRAEELPFAGHPNIGSAFVLAAAGLLGDIGEHTQITFEEIAGPVPVTICKQADNNISCELQAPAELSLGTTLSIEQVASVLSLPPEAIEVHTHQPQQASVGLPFVITELKTRAALQTASVDLQALRELAASGVRPGMYVYTRSGDDFDIRARMFAPLGGTVEDPATGSANCALAGLLSHYEAAPDGDFSWRIAQGVEMQRPSVLEARTTKRNGAVTGVWIAGLSVMVSQGQLEI